MKKNITTVIGMLVCCMMMTTFAWALNIPGVPNGTVTDGNLVWLQNADCFGKMNWDNAKSRAASLKSGECGLTDGSRAGDWRLPTKEELQRRAQNTQGFNNVRSDVYWSSSSYPGGTSNVWVVYMYVGSVSYDYKGLFNYVWPVRAVQ